MKVAVVSDDGKTVSAHFGMARFYLVYQIEGGQIKGKEVREKAAHGPGEGHHGPGAPEAGERVTHQMMLSNVEDCEAVVARGMGAPMYLFLKNSGKKIYITMRELADEAVGDVVGGTVDNRTELLH